ncbi:TetR/AcrR family transcriptional regulator [Levilactobacillus cerevisiae]|uniref:TetR/AcrR family transcriptional regulator n=1 Tax=Levilactobacillus cerevisiae TaxID=1704076 RepID=UPI000F77CEF7|nr:TetR/AcrR family transcriptional regulator [Levilactobacillus cerevisiae]
MRKIDEGKKERVKLAVFEITRDEGIAGLSFGKIAKHANVSSGTPYVYYKDKTDMLGKIYLDVKDLLDTGLRASIAAGKTPEDKLFNCVYHFAQQFHEHPLESIYLDEVRDNPKVVTAEVIRQGNRLAQPVDNLFQELNEAGMFVINNQETLYALLFAPFIMVQKQRVVTDQPMMLSELETVIRLSIQGVLKNR